LDQNGALDLGIVSITYIMRDKAELPKSGISETWGQRLPGVAKASTLDPLIPSLMPKV